MKILIAISLLVSGISGVLISPMMQDKDQEERERAATAWIAEHELPRVLAEAEKKRHEANALVDELKRVSGSNLWRYEKLSEEQKRKHQSQIQELQKSIGLLATNAKRYSGTAPQELKMKLLNESRDSNKTLRWLVGQSGRPTGLFQTNGFGFGSHASKELRESQQALGTLVEKLKQTESESEREDLSDEIREALSTFYDEQLKAHDDRLSELRDQLDKMESQVEKRRSAADEMIDLRLKLLMRQAELGDFSDVFKLNGLTGNWSLQNFSNPHGINPPILGRKFPVPDSPVLPHFPKSPHFPETAKLSIDLSGKDDTVELGIPELGETLSDITGKLEKEENDNVKLVYFVSRNKLVDGKLSIKGGVDGDRLNSIKTTFNDELPFVQVKLGPGGYRYSYEQDGEVIGKGEFEKLDSSSLVIEIETSEPAPELLEDKKVIVTFDANESEISGTLWVRGTDSSYSSREFQGELEGALEFEYLPGEYVFIFVADDRSSLSVQSFTVEDGIPMTVKIFKSSKNNKEEQDETN